MTAHSRRILVGLVLPGALAVAAFVFMLAVSATLPDPIATHWGPDGVDGFGPFWASAILPLVIVAGYSILTVVVLRSARERMTVIQKLLIVTAPFLGGTIAVIGAGSAFIQRGLTDARDAPSIVPVVLVALAAGLVLAVLSWFVLPRTSPPQPLTATDLPTLDLTATTRAAWVAHAGPPLGISILVISLLVLAVLVGGVALWVAAPLPVLLVFLGVMIVIIVLGPGSLFWRVSVDHRGFRAVSVLGWPRFAYPLSEVTAATVASINPLGDFGGWGMRWGRGGRFGIILRAGEALAVSRANGKTFYVTVPGAKTGAALLNSLVATRVE